MGGASFFVLGQRGSRQKGTGGGQKNEAGAILSEVNPPQIPQ